jgi:ribosomal protein L21
MSGMKVKYESECIKNVLGKAKMVLNKLDGKYFEDRIYVKEEGVFMAFYHGSSDIGLFYTKYEVPQDEANNYKPFVGGYTQLKIIKLCQNLLETIHEDADEVWLDAVESEKVTHVLHFDVDTVIGKPSITRAQVEAKIKELAMAEAIKTYKRRSDTYKKEIKKRTFWRTLLGMKQ